MILFSLFGVPFLLAVIALGGLCLWAGTNSIRSRTAETRTSTAARGTWFHRERATIRFTGPAAQVIGVGTICFGIWLIAESLLMGTSITVNELLTTRRESRPNHFREIARKMRLVIGIVAAVSLFLAFGLHIAGILN